MQYALTCVSQGQNAPQAMYTDLRHCGNLHVEARVMFVNVAGPSEPIY